MAGVTEVLPADLRVAPRANIRRDTSSQRPHIPWAESIAQGLARFASLADEDAARADLDARLSFLRGALRDSPYHAGRTTGRASTRVTSRRWTT